VTLFASTKILNSPETCGPGQTRKDMGDDGVLHLLVTEKPDYAMIHCLFPDPTAVQHRRVSSVHRRYFVYG
jgi:hypothetical protein